MSAVSPLGFSGGRMQKPPGRTSAPTTTAVLCPPLGAGGVQGTLDAMLVPRAVSGVVERCVLGKLLVGRGVVVLAQEAALRRHQVAAAAALDIEGARARDGAACVLGDGEDRAAVQAWQQGGQCGRRRHRGVWERVGRRRRRATRRLAAGPSCRRRRERRGGPSLGSTNDESEARDGRLACLPTQNANEDAERLRSLPVHRRMRTEA
jgi:hypothetical protein